MLQIPSAYQNLLQNFTPRPSTGFTTSFSYPIKRSFKRIGITYSFDDTSVQTFSTASTLYFESINFRGIYGPNSLTGIQTSKVVPNFSYSNIDNPQHPHKERAFSFPRA